MITLTVFFEAPFWVGIFEDVENGKLKVCKVVFGAEPRDYDIYELILKDYYNLKFGKPMDAATRHVKHPNPKRMNREIGKTLQKQGVGTKAQRAVSLAREEHKKEKRQISKEEQICREKELFSKKQKKKKAKKKGH